MQRREFIAAVGVVAAGAASQSNPTYAQPIGAVANGAVLFRPNRAMDCESDSGRSASYTALRSALRVANNTNRSCSRLAMVALPATIR
jgi:hypothetical protein